MPRACCFVSIIVLALMTGCSSPSIHIWYTSTQELVQQHNYQKAIAQIRAETPHNLQLVLKVKKLAKQHLHQQSKKIELFIKDKEWGQAKKLVSSLAFNQPKGTVLTHLSQAIDKAQKEEERLLNTRLFLVNADLLDIEFRQQALSDRIHFDRFDWFNQSQHLKEKKHQLAEDLLHLSTQALKVKDYENAQLAYEKAIEFDKQLGKGELKKAINAGLSFKNDAAIQQRQQSLIRQINKAIVELNFKHLLIVQEILSHNPFRGPEVNQALKNARKLRQEHAQILDLNAGKLYRKGNILKSVELWEQALTLTPSNHNLKEKLLRAKKVQRKLEKLSSSDYH